MGLDVRNMKHEWIYREATLEHFGKEPQRTCKHCGKTQDRTTETDWGRVVSYRWLPFAGLCTGLTSKRHR